MVCCKEVYESLDDSDNGVSGSYLIISDGVGEVLDKAVQDLGMVNVVEEFQNPVLFRKRFELHYNTSQLPADGL